MRRILAGGNVDAAVLERTGGRSVEAARSLLGASRYRNSRQRFSRGYEYSDLQVFFRPCTGSRASQQPSLHNLKRSAHFTRNEGIPTRVRVSAS